MIYFSWFLGNPCNSRMWIDQDGSHLGISRIKLLSSSVNTKLSPPDKSVRYMSYQRCHLNFLCPPPWLRWRWVESLPYLKQFYLSSDLSFLSVESLFRKGQMPICAEMLRGPFNISSTCSDSDCESSITLVKVAPIDLFVSCLYQWGIMCVFEPWPLWVWIIAGKISLIQLCDHLKLQFK